MKTRQIPRNEWTRFFNAFSQRQEGWRVKLEVLRPDIGDQVEEKDLFFAGVVAELSDKGDKIEVMLGGNPNKHVTHVIENPVLIEVQQNELGVDAALQIKTADGTTNLLHLR